MEEGRELIALKNFRGESRWVQRGPHCYTAARNRRASVSYRCGSTGCPVKFTFKAGVPGPIRGVHNHAPEPWIPQRNEMFSKIKDRCVSAERTALQTIYEEEAVRYENAAPHLLYENLISSMKKWRRSAAPAIPRTLQAYGSALAEHPQYSDLHLATISAGGANAVLLAMSGYGECLRECHTVVLDGTFKTLPAGIPAYQLLTIHGIVGGQHYHPVVALMENRRQTLYEAVLSRVWQLADQPQPQSVVTDYEPALQAATRAVIAAPTTGCYFHYLQALVKRARQEHLPMERTSRGGRLVRLYGALALLPATRIEAAFAELPHAAQSLGVVVHEGLHTYFADFWMARIGPESFSVYQRSERTSNTAESFHAYLKNMLGASPNVWRFTRTYKNLIFSKRS